MIYQRTDQPGRTLEAAWHRIAVEKQEWERQLTDLRDMVVVLRDTLERLPVSCLEHEACRCPMCEYRRHVEVILENTCPQNSGEELVG